MNFLNNQATKIVGGMPKMKGGIGVKEYVEIEKEEDGSYKATIRNLTDICPPAVEATDSTATTLNTDAEVAPDATNPDANEPGNADDANKVVEKKEEVEVTPVVEKKEEVEVTPVVDKEKEKKDGGGSGGGARRKKARKSAKKGAKKGAKKSAKRKSAKRKSVKRKGRK